MPFVKTEEGSTLFFLKTYFEVDVSYAEIVLIP